MRVPLALHAVVLSLLLVPVLSAQDAVKVDARHYTVITDNAEVRVLRVHYGAHEKSTMHSHPDSVAVFLTDASIVFTLADGKKRAARSRRATRSLLRPGTHLPEEHWRQGDGGNPS